jgi:catechol 2,3-dioxygenase-like lactoylglutathione lyase family enzyme
MNDRVVEIKAFVPAKDYALSLRFYADMGFTLASDTEGVACFHHGTAAFLLQRFYDEHLAGNFVMHLLVEDVDAWWQRLHDSALATTYKVSLTQPELRPWGMRDFTLTDPCGVLWRIAENVPRR